ncbi:MAG: hypothetical protein KDJ70_21690, partial [Candidatus Competibacteraceae bacterium]|nr:hypothetical protein [Candidatus Competibacteraceae bacterium]
CSCCFWHGLVPLTVIRQAAFSSPLVRNFSPLTVMSKVIFSSPLVRNFSPLVRNFSPLVRNFSPFEAAHKVIARAEHKNTLNI